jgi:Berberine and berberine like
VDIFNTWTDSTSIQDIQAVERVFRHKQLPILKKIAGAHGAAYSNEADVLESDFQNVFYGSNYARLSQIKSKYDPNDLFIVRTGVGSERWDSYGLCRVDFSAKKMGR